MAQYKREIIKWIHILMDKVVFDQAFSNKGTGLNAEEAYLISRFEDGMSLDEFHRCYQAPRRVSKKLLDRLIKEKILEKCDDLEDKRRKQLILTEKGRILKEKIQESFDKRLNDILSDLTVNEEVAVLKFISKINQITVEKFQIK